MEKGKKGKKGGGPARHLSRSVVPLFCAKLSDLLVLTAPFSCQGAKDSPVACKRDISQWEFRLKALQYQPLRQATGPLGIDELGGKEHLTPYVIRSPACTINRASVCSKEHLLDSFTQGYANSSQPRSNYPWCSRCNDMLKELTWRSRSALGGAS